MVDGKPQIAATKTAKSRRDLPLPPAMIEILKNHRDRQAKQAQAFGWTQTDDSWVFTNNNGQPLRPDSVYRHFKQLIARLGLPEITLHDLRHIFASVLDEMGTTPKVKADLMGHTTTQVTDGTHTHTSERVRTSAVERVAEALQRRTADSSTVEGPSKLAPSGDDTRQPLRETGFGWPIE